MKFLQRIHMKSLLSIALLFIAVALISSCENTDQTSVSQAQACLDQATTPTAASSCVTILGSLQSADAYLIRCSAHFISQGFTTPRFVLAYNALTATKSGSNATATSMSFLSFKSTAGTDGSLVTLGDCQKSNVQSLNRLAVLAHLATTIAEVAKSLTPGIVYDPNSGFPASAITNAINNFNAGGGDPAGLGTTAIAASAAYCADGSSFQTSSVCTTLTGAITPGASAATIGAALLAQLKKTP
jgi:hypothetical protein